MYIKTFGCYQDLYYIEMYLLVLETLYMN